MKTNWLAGASLAAVGLLAGCSTEPTAKVASPPQPTVAYDVLVEASPPGASIEADGVNYSNTPVHLKILGNLDRTFHDFGSSSYIIRAFPIASNQYVQTRVYFTGKDTQIKDVIPKSIYIDMNIPPVIDAPEWPSYAGVNVYPNYNPDYCPYPWYFPYAWWYPYGYYNYYYGPRRYYHYGPRYYYGQPNYYGPRYYNGPHYFYRH